MISGQSEVELDVLELVMVKIHVEQKEDLVGQIYKACKNMYYSSAGTLWNTSDSIFCY